MKRYPMIFVAIVSAVLLTAGVSAQRGGSAAAELEATTQRAAVTGDLSEAIRGYGRIADRYAKSDPAVAAMALVRMAQAYESQGNGEARRIYERIVKEFPSQKDAAALALLALGATTAPHSVVTREINVQGLYTVSPDGRYAFTGDNEIHDLLKGTRRPFGSGDGNSDSVSVSRDGKHFAYVWEKLDARRECCSAELRVASTGAGSAQDRTLFSKDSSIDWLWGHDWTPDDKEIAIVVTRKDSCEIGLISVDDGRYRRLKSIDSRRSVPGGPFINPLDGRYIAFDVADDSTGRQRDVFVLTIDQNGVETARIVDSPTDDAVVGWSPDGKYLVFASRRTSGVTDLRALPFAGGKPAGTPMVIRPNIGPFESFGITRSGALFYAVPRPPSRFQIADVGVSAERVEPSSLSGAVEIVGSSPRFSPNGKQVAYSTEETAFGRRPRLYTLWVRSLDSPYTLHRIETGPVTFSSVSGWSTDGRSLLGIGGIDGQPRRGIYEIDVATDRVSLLVPDCDCQYPKLSPDGAYLYFVRRLEGSVMLVSRELASGRERELIRQATSFAHELSPDGQYLAYADNSEPPGKVAVMPASGGRPTELIEGTFLSWTPDSRSVLVATRRATSMVSLDGTSRRTPTLDGLLPPLFGFGAVGFSPDGRHVTFGVPDRATASPLRVLENFLPGD